MDTGTIIPMLNGWFNICLELFKIRYSFRVLSFAILLPIVVIGVVISTRRRSRKKAQRKFTK